MLNVFGLFKSSETLSSQALSWQSRIIAAGGSIDNAVLTIIDNNLIKPMVSSGIFDCLDKFNLFAGTGNRVAATVNIINSPVNYNYTEYNIANLQWLNTSGFRSTVQTQNVGGYLFSAYNAPVSLKWGADKFNNGQFIMMLNPTFPANTNMSGYGTGTSTKYNALDRTSAAGLRVYSSSNTNATNNNTVTSGKVWMAGFRSANSVSAIINSSTVVTTVTPLANVPQGSWGELSVDGQNNTINYDTSYHMASGNGNGNYDNQLLRTYILNTFTALGI